MTNQPLINRLNRATGQIDSIKKQLQSDTETDCMQVLQQLKASINALKKFGEAYMSDHVESCITKGMTTDDMKENLKTVISGAFSL